MSVEVFDDLTVEKTEIFNISLERTGDTDSRIRLVPAEIFITDTDSMSLHLVIDSFHDVVFRGQD